MRISSTSFSSFIGDVRPLWIEGEGDLQYAPISWSCVGDAVEIHRFSGAEHCTFNYGILLTFVKEGDATVTAKCGDEVFSCAVSCRKRRDFSNEKMNFYKGDFHTHTSSEHKHDAFLRKNGATIKEYLDSTKEQNLKDVAVITDHSSTTNLMDFFRGFCEYEKMKDEMGPIVYAGCENEVMFTKMDRFGYTHRRSGEMVSINACNISQSNTYEEFLWTFKGSRYAIGIFAHPHVLGYSTRGVWDFTPRLNNSLAMRSFIKYVEVLGNPHKENMLHEYTYSDALDAGYRLSAVCSSDQHHTWDFTAYPGATIIMAPEKSREAFTDALLNFRAYACESGNIKLSYSVNGKCAPCDLEPVSKYHFTVEISYFEEDNATRPIRCDVISDGGVTVKRLENINFESFEFDIETDTARWFYLRFVDSNTKRTFSPPVFLGRPAKEYRIDDITPIDKANFKITDANGSDASALIDNSPETGWESDTGRCELIIDMGKSRQICAFGSYAPFVKTPFPPPQNVGEAQGMLEGVFPAEFIISLSKDGKNYTEAVKGVFRSFTGEEIVRFSKSTARYVKFQVLSTTGKILGRAPYDALPLKLCELSVFE
jgi:hypothetical protein